MKAEIHASFSERKGFRKMKASLTTMEVVTCVVFRIALPISQRHKTLCVLK